MNIQIRIFPIAGLCNEKKELELALEKGNFYEAQARLEELLGISFRENKTLMFLHNGQGLDRNKDIVFREGDQLWLMPLLSGG